MCFSIGLADGGVHLAQAVGRVEVAAREEEDHHARLRDVLLERADLLQVVDVEEDEARRERVADVLLERPGEVLRVQVPALEPPLGGDEDQALARALAESLSPPVAGVAAEAGVGGVADERLVGEMVTLGIEEAAAAAALLAVSLGDRSLSRRLWPFAEPSPGLLPLGSDRLSASSLGCF